MIPTWFVILQFIKIKRQDLQLTFRNKEVIIIK